MSIASILTLGVTQGFLFCCCWAILQGTHSEKMAEQFHQAKQFLEMPNQQSHQLPRSAWAQLSLDAVALCTEAAPVQQQNAS